MSEIISGDNADLLDRLAAVPTLGGIPREPVDGEA